MRNEYGSNKVEKITEETALARATNHDEEIDLIALIQDLWKQKWWIFTITALIAIVATAYAFFAKPIYEGKSSIQSPSLSDIAWLNLGRNGGDNTKEDEDNFKAFSVKDIYAIFIKHLLSENMRWQFFNEIWLPAQKEKMRPGSENHLYRHFSEKLKIKRPSKDSENYTVLIKHHGPLQAIKWSRGYIDLAAQRAIEEIKKDIQQEIEVKKRSLDDRIVLLRDIAEQKRKDSIIRLKEALHIAESLKLENPQLLNLQTNTQITFMMDENPAYIRGTKALHAEIKSLESRISNDPFIGELRNLQQKHILYTRLQQNTKEAAVAVYRLDNAIEIPDEPVWPKKALIIVLGFVLGGILSIFVVMMKRVIAEKKKINQSERT